MSNSAQIPPKSSIMPVSAQHQLITEPGTHSAPLPQTILKEDDKMPLFLIKLWNIVEDPNYYDVIRWDDSGYSFHILDPYSFCRNVLPQYFKHNNLNSLIRQLNMYGFRKMTPIERTSLARLESDQDHLEFSHPCFVREHPELLSQIKRKTPTSRKDDGVSHAPSKDLSSVLEEVRVLRERQKSMEDRMNDLVTDNNAMWQQMTSMRQQHVKQQQIVNKLVQFLVTLVQPKRLAKRHMLAIDEFASPKKARTAEPTESSNGINHQSLQTIQHSNVNDILDNLMKEISKSNTEFNLNNVQNGPIISDVTDELDHLSTSSAQVNHGDYMNSPIPNNTANMGGYDPNVYGYQSHLQAPPMMPVVQQQQQQPPVTPQHLQQQQPQQQQPIPRIVSPNNVMHEEPLVLSPNDQLGFTTNDFTDYLNGVDHSIDNCRDLIGDHWNSFDFDNLLSSGDPSPPGDHGFPQPSLSLEHTHPQTVFRDSLYPSQSTAIPPQMSQQQGAQTSPQMGLHQQPQLISTPPRNNRRKR